MLLISLLVVKPCITPSYLCVIPSLNVYYAVLYLQRHEHDDDSIEHYEYENYNDLEDFNAFNIDWNKYTGNSSPWYQKDNMNTAIIY